MATEQQDGLLLQGTDGDVYFIPADRMSEFRVADEDAAGVKEALGAIDRDEDEVSGFSFQPQQELKTGVSPVLAFSGPLGIKPPVARLDEGDGIYR